MTSTASDYKYRIPQLMSTYGGTEMEKIIIAELLIALGISIGQLREKLYARLGQNGTRYSFSPLEMQMVLQVMNRHRPFRKQLVIAQLYHPNVKIGG